jgi:hypothetical protein
MEVFKMNAKDAMIGTKYLSPTRVPVVMRGMKEDKVLLEVLVSGNTVEVKGDYQLIPYNVEQVDKMSKVMLDEREVAKEIRQAKKKENVETKETKTMSTDTEKKTRGGISAIIDPLLFEGGRTVAEIVEVVKTQNPELADGRNLTVNVRVRMSTLQKRGFRLEEDAQKRVKLVK